MIKLLHKIILKPVKGIDNYLLISFPLIWSSKIIFLIYIEFLIFGLNLFIEFVQPISYTNVPQIEWFFYYNIVLQSIVLYGWLYYQRLLDVKYYQGKFGRFCSSQIALYFAFSFTIMTLSVLIPYYLFANRISEKMIDQNLPSVSYAYFYQLNYRNIGSLYEKEYIDSSVTSYDSPAAVSYDSIDSSVANSALSYSRLEAQSRKNIVIALGSNVLKEFDDFKLVSDTQNPYVQYRYSPYINNAPIYPKIYYNDVSDDSTYSEKFNRWIYKRRIRCHINGALNDSFVTRSFFFLSGRKAGSDSIVVSDINLLNYLLVKYKMIEDAAFRRYPDRRNSEMTRNDIGLFEETQRFSFMDDIYDNYRRFLHAQDIKNDVLGILDLGVSISIYLSALWFIIYSIRKLFGIKMFLLGLVLPVILSAILVICISTDFMELNPHEYLLLLLILYFFMLALSFFVKKNKKYHKILLQLSIYSTFILLGLFSVLLPKVFQFPDFISNIPIQWYFYCIASCSVLFSIYFFERTYKLFLKPESK